MDFHLATGLSEPSPPFRTTDDESTDESAAKEELAEEALALVASGDASAATMALWKSLRATRTLSVSSSFFSGISGLVGAITDAGAPFGVDVFGGASSCRVRVNSGPSSFGQTVHSYVPGALSHSL